MSSLVDYLNFFCIRFFNCQSEAFRDSERERERESLFCVAYDLHAGLSKGYDSLKFTLLLRSGSASQQKIGILRSADDCRRRRLFLSFVLLLPQASLVIVHKVSEGWIAQ